MTIPTLSRSPVRSRESSLREGGRFSSPFQDIARVLLISTICAAPWAFGAVQSWAWGTLMVLSLLTLVVWAVGCAYRGVLKISWSPLYWPFLVFLFVAVLQLVAGLSVDHVATREAVLKIVTNFVFFFLTGQLLNAQRENGRALEWVGRIVYLLALAICIEGLVQLYWGGNLRVIYGTFHVTGAAFGPYVNHNNYAGLMEMLLPISAAYILSRPWNPPLLFLAWCGLGLVVTSIWVSGSRGATLVLLIEGLIWASILIWKRPRGVSPRLFAMLGGVVLISAVVFSWMVSTGRVGTRALSVFEPRGSLEVKLGERLLVGVDTLRMARSNPWIGVGVGSFESVFPNYLTSPMDRHWTHAHDDVLEAAAETGLPGVVIILVSLALFVRVAFGHIAGRLQHKWGWIQLGAAVGAAGLFFHSFVDFNLRVPANAAWFVVCLAIATHGRPAQANPRMVVWDSGADRNSEFIN
ncbi:MAG: O-antigen ligase family protein [Terriglobia bacterium]